MKIIKASKVVCSPQHEEEIRWAAGEAKLHVGGRDLSRGQGADRGDVRRR